MLATSATLLRRAALSPAAAAVKPQLRLLSALPSPLPPNSAKTSQHGNSNRQLHATVRRDADASVNVGTARTTTTAAALSSSLLNRFTLTAEVAVSKIFPAGFGWQSGAIVADTQLGFAPDTMNFALTTGLGDALGVLLGHVTYYAAKKAVTGTAIDMNKELQTGILLGSAAFCSGTAWQPLVNALQGANVSFGTVFAGTWLGCGAAFYVGLRIARTILSGPLPHIDEPTYENSKADVALSAAIGGATGFFVGTDVAYLPEQNFLLPVVGIQDGTSDLAASAIAGTSTALGFVTAQSTMNMIYPTGKCWVD